MNLAELIKSIPDSGECVKCGSCRTVCPTFNSSHREGASARGKIALMDAVVGGEEGFGDTYIKHLNDCTLCGACYEVCPKDVNTPELVMAARADVVRRDGLGIIKSFVYNKLFFMESLLGFGVRVASFFQRILFRLNKNEEGQISRFSILPVIGKGRLLPILPHKTFMQSDMAKDNASKVNLSGKTAAFFVGCGINYLVTNVGDATVNVIKKAGGSVFVPEGQLCCSMPAVASGDFDSARKLALRNIDIFEKESPEFIVTSCASCGHNMKENYRTLFEDADAETRKRVEWYSSRVRDITEFLVNDLEYKPSEQLFKDGSPVTYHDPCHLGRGQNLKDQPRELIKASGAELREMDNQSCCGLGGGLAFENYEMTIDISSKKAKSIERTGAGIVATACPGCMVQTRDGLNKEGVDVRVKHIVELL